MASQRFQHVDGIPEARQQFRRLEAKMQRATLRNVFRKAGNVVAKEARRLAPRDEGDLRKAIAVSVSATNDRVLVDIGVRKGKTSRHQDAFYWRFIEIGTRFIAARPFLRPALSGKRDEAVAKIGGELNDEIGRVVARRNKQIARRAAG
jgi:HK97 gp10 family phage protein